MEVVEEHGRRRSVKFMAPRPEAGIGSVDRPRPVRQSWEQTPGRGVAAEGRRRSSKTPATGAAVESAPSGKHTPMQGSFSPRAAVRTSPSEAIAVGTFTVHHAPHETAAPAAERHEPAEQAAEQAAGMHVESLFDVHRPEAADEATGEAASTHASPAAREGASPPFASPTPASRGPCRVRVCPSSGQVGVGGHRSVEVVRSKTCVSILDCKIIVCFGFQNEES